MIVPIDRFTLDSRHAEQTAKSTLLLGGRRLGAVRGSHIDAQFGCDDLGAIVFVSFQHIFSAVETIYFVDPAGGIGDHLSLGSPMEQGLISDFAVDGPRSVRFKFPMDELRSVEVRRQAAWFGLRVRWLHLR